MKKRMIAAGLLLAVCVGAGVLARPSACYEFQRYGIVLAGEELLTVPAGDMEELGRLAGDASTGELLREQKAEYRLPKEQVYDLYLRATYGEGEERRAYLNGHAGETLELAYQGHWLSIAEAQEC